MLSEVHRIDNTITNKACPLQLSQILNPSTGQREKNRVDSNHKRAVKVEDEQI